MGNILDKITELIKEMLQGWVLTNLEGMFTQVNDKVGTIAGEVSKTPSDWNAGIAQTEAQKSQDMFNKCRYLDELTGGKGVTFATGTPISNSMTELYTNMRYLQYNTLEKMGLLQFDAWAATFGEVKTSIELAPEGTGYRAKTRFAKFFNLPELMSLFKECADIQTPDMLKLPVPEAKYENVTLKPSEAQKEMVQSLADRAERVRNRMVDSSVDNIYPCEGREGKRGRQDKKT